MDGIWSIVAIVAVFGIMYAVLIIPQRKKEKKTKAMLDALAVGDSITTIGGIVGSVVNIKEDDVTIETSVEKTKMHVKKWSVRTVSTGTDSE